MKMTPLDRKDRFKRENRTLSLRSLLIVFSMIILYGFILDLVLFFRSGWRIWGYFTEIFLGIAIVYVIVKLVFWLVYRRR
jgi:hypothetical protein